jgi:hypothetical protein
MNKTANIVDISIKKNLDALNLSKKCEHNH